MRASLWSRVSLDAPERLFAGAWEVVVYTHASEGKRPEQNQDACWVGLVQGQLIVALADGVGGHPGGARAAARALAAFEALQAPGDEHMPLPLRAMQELSMANEELAGVGKGSTTVVAAILTGEELASLHVGDSSLLVASGTGRVKLRTVAHSPAGYAIESGRLDERDVLEEDDHHLVSRVIGMRPFSAELSVGVRLAPRDTIVLGSDGLFDNLSADDVARIAAQGELADAGQALLEALEARMGSDQGKVDDHAFTLARIARDPPPGSDTAIISSTAPGEDEAESD